MRVLFSDVNGQNVGGFLVKFEKTLMFQLMGCSDTWTEINSKECKTKVTRSWKFDHKGNIMIVKCNGELVIKFNLKNTNERNRRCNLDKTKTDWNRQIGFFSIDGINDQASFSYEIRK